MLPVAHSDPVASAYQIRHRCLQRRPRAERPRRKPRYGTHAFDHMAVNDASLGELWHCSWKQLPHQEVDDILVRHARYGPGVVKVTSQHRPLGRLVAPQRRLVRLQLVQHEERAARSAECLKAREDVCRRFGGNVPVEPYSRGDHVDAPKRSCFRKLRATACEGWTPPHQPRHAFSAECQNNAIEALKHHFSTLAFGITHASHLAVLEYELGRTATTLHRHSGSFEAFRKGAHKVLLDRALFHPTHVEGRLVRQSVIVQQLHGHRRRELFRRLEKSNQQRRPDEIIHQALADAHPDEELMSGHPIVRLEGFFVPGEVQHRIQQACHRQPIGHWQPLEAREACGHLPQRAWELGEF
mmetsp:Transcript_102061/g.288217  ORF Transcript_102061/g.288217 Transcript_102061/m.288217 type:complete len:355 (+) Transcript_102061:263-1327(+)